MSRKVIKLEDMHGAPSPDYHEDTRLIDGKLVTILICDACGAQRTVGQNPFCPHDGFGAALQEPFTEYVDPHLLPHSDPRAHDSEFNPRLGRVVTGVRITSREQRRRIMKETNTDWAPRPQGEGAEF